MPTCHCPENHSISLHAEKAQGWRRGLLGMEGKLGGGINIYLPCLVPLHALPSFWLLQIFVTSMKIPSLGCHASHVSWLLFCHVPCQTSSPLRRQRNGLFFTSPRIYVSGSSDHSSEFIPEHPVTGPSHESSHSIARSMSRFLPDRLLSLSVKGGPRPLTC